MKKLSITLVMALFTAVNNFAVNVEIGGLRYELNWNSREAVVRSGIYSGEIVIPESVNHEGLTYTVVKIDDSAFSNCDITSVLLPSSITVIGSNSFSNCKQLTSFEIPKNVKSIGNSAFSGCSSLTSILIHDNVQSLGSYAFDNCTSLSHVALGTGIGQINQFTFHNCAISDIEIPASITLIGDRAFANCSSLSTINIPDGVKSIGLGVFEGCVSLVSVELSDQISDLSSVFSGCINLKVVKLPSSLMRLFGTFSGCSSLESVMLPEGLEEIGGSTFRKSGITSIEIPASVTIIDQDAFSFCNDLKEISLKEGLIEIGNRAFQSCSKLQSIIIPHSVTTIGIDAFRSNSSLLSVVVGDGITSIPEGAFAWCGSLRSIVMGKSVSSIGHEAFAYCSSLNEITINDISAWCNIYHKRNPFSYPYNLYCNGEELLELAIPNGVESISSYAFYNCQNIKTVTIPNSVQSIGNYSFENCKMLETVIIGNGMNSIGNAAFEQCSNLTNVYCYTQELPYGNESVFYNTNINNGILYVPASSMNAYKNTAPWNSFREILSTEKFNVQYVVAGEVYENDSLNAGVIITPPAISEKKGYTFSWQDYPTIMPAQDVTVTGTFSVNKYKLACIVDGETMQSDSVAYGTAITLFEEPTKEGYTFSGWSEIPEIMPANDVTISGTFIVNKYFVTFKIGDEVIAADSLEYGTAIVVPEAPDREGCTFDGWGEVAETVPAGDLTYEGSYTINSYQLTYVVDGVIVKRDSVVYGTAITLLEEPTREGHTFSGWSEAPETMPAEDVTISGTFTINKYLVTFKIGDEVIAADSLEHGAVIVAPEAPEKEGHTFDGWGEVADSVPANDLTYEGSYSVNSYLLSYTVDGDTLQSDSVAYGTAISLPEEPTKEGHTFSGWSEAPETMPANDVVISGTFTINKYLVTFKVGDEVIAADSLEYGAVIVAPEAPEKEGHTFDGWGEVAETVPANDLTYEGNYSVNSYLLSYAVDGETVQSDSVAYGTAITLLDEPVKEGHTFSGWSEAPETMPAEDVTISGAFTINKYFVTFKIGDEVIAADSLEYGATIVASEAPEKEGHTFNGWGEVAETVSANDLTYEGNYSVNSYLLSYAVDGETVQSDSVAYGTAIILLDEPVKEGHTFSGWSEAPETMPAEDVTISGTFAISKYLVTFTIGEEVIAADSLEYGAAIVAPEAPEKEGYTFNGWGEVAETVPAGDVTYEGTYTVNIYKVYYYVGEELVHTAEVAYGEAIPEYIYKPMKEGDIFNGWSGETYETMPTHDVTYVANITNGIDAMSTVNGQQTTVIYNLTGRKVTDTENLKGGIYIVNGRKVVIND